MYPLFVINALELLGVAIVLPVAFGVIGRVVFFRRDPDDVSSKVAASEKGLDFTAFEVEPEPVYGQPWEFVQSPAKVYDGVTPDTNEVEAAINEAWANFTEAPPTAELAAYRNWIGPAPYVLAAASGAGGRTAMLSVSARAPSMSEAYLLMLIWDRFILRHLQSRFGGGGFTERSVDSRHTK